MRRKVVSTAIAIFGAMAVLPDHSALGQSEPGQSPSAISQQNPKGEESLSPPLARGANSFAESQAKALIESKGYSDVSVLVNDSNGIWRGTATKGTWTGSVSVDYQGHVIAQ